LNILIVGGNGNLGTGCDNVLRSLGIRTVIWDIPRDLFKLTSDELLENSIDLMVNFSVLVDQKSSEIRPDSDDFRVNVFGLSHLLNICSKVNIPLIQISTREVIGTRDFRIADTMSNSTLRAVDEREPCLPKTSYGKTKLISEWILSKDTNSAVIRLNTCYTDEWRGGKGLIGALVRKSRADGEVTLDNLGHAIRDPLHIDDLTQLILSVHEKRFYGNIIHAGGGNQNIYSLRDICTLANPKVQINPGIVNDDYGFIMDISLAQSLGWNPKILFSNWINSH
jgi:nucleoside-diphosphate-sugar epimerase